MRGFARFVASVPLALVASVFLLIGGASAQPAPNARPTGGIVLAGSAVISQSTSTTTVTQSSQSAVVSWQSFNVGSLQSVNLILPNASATMLVRAASATPSLIAGRITVNGQLFTVNANGIYFYRGSQLKAGGGIVISTLDISTGNFMMGQRIFERINNKPVRAISNAGTIMVNNGGYAALIGGTIGNSGVISVPLGTAAFGAADKVGLNFAAGGLLQLSFPTKGALGPDGQPAEPVANSGVIKSTGGTISISAYIADAAANKKLSIGGQLQAPTISAHRGAIQISGGPTGAVTISGDLTAASSKVVGGVINATGQAINLSGAVVDVSGYSGGGKINIGGGRQGAGALLHADTTTVNAATKVKADAIHTGNGGNVVFWSDQSTAFAGSISARGGAVSGNGGNAEVGSAGTRTYSGSADLSAPHGKPGTLSLD
jgi:filamentous hemagglutinin family protein